MAYTDEKHKEAGRKLLKIALEEHGITDYEVKYTKTGKPYVDGIHFSISHSERLVAVAVSENEIGLDVQYIKSVREKTVNRVCNERELAKIANSENKDKAFCKIWACKESYVKMTGEGLTKDYDKIPYCANTLVMGNYVIAISPKQKIRIKWVRI